MASRTFELMIAAPRDALVDEFYAGALGEWNPELFHEGAEEVDNDLPFGWTGQGSGFTVKVAIEPVGESTELTVTVTAGLLAVGGVAKVQKQRFEELRRRVEARG
ncbi:MAG: hypothetical protein JNL83_35540 [Myxococcales bacterium]|nr:hypothetical protein [Myxococcales bacterium]